MRVLTGEQMRDAEKRAVAAGTSYERLMEDAGCGAAEKLQAQFLPLMEKPVLILLGKGNNGGDGLVIARRLLEKNPTLTVRLLFCLGRELSPLAALNLERLSSFGERVETFDAARMNKPALDGLCGESALILDGIFGTGFHGLLPSSLSCILQAANNANALRIALDIPTGVNGDNGLFDPDAFRAGQTLAFAARKPAHLLKSSRVLCGEVKVIPIGIPERMLEKAGDCSPTGGITVLSRTLVRSLLPVRAPDSNKGSFGKLLIMGGCRTMTGAVLLAASAAARCGTGLVMTAAPEEALLPVRIRLPEALQLPLPLAPSGAVSEEAHPPLLQKANGWSSAVLAGCGMGLSDETKALVKTLLEKCSKPLVLDADGLNALAALGTDLLLTRGETPIVLTPHLLEFSRLSGLTLDEIRADRFQIAADFARKYRVTLVLKDSSTTVASPDGQLFLNENGNSGLAKGGSGDTLAGIISAFLAQGLSPTSAALLGVYLHASAGDIAAEQKTAYAMLPQDVIEELPSAFLRLTQT